MEKGPRYGLKGSRYDSRKDRCFAGEYGFSGRSDAPGGGRLSFRVPYGWRGTSSASAAMVAYLARVHIAL